MEEWFEQHFQEDYLRIYDHRDEEEADRVLSRLYPYLNMQPGQTVLDLCCGEGRHCRWLTAKELRVVGVDLSPVLLQEAVKKTLNEPVSYMRADARKIDFENEFDLVINMFTSFGYFSQNRDNERVLELVSRALRPGGQFLLDYINPRHLENHLEPYSQMEKGSLHVEQYRSIQNNKVTKEIIVREGEDERRYTEKVQLYSLEDMEAMLGRNQLSVRHTFGDYDVRPFDSETSPRMIFLCEKA